jgi:hypothetical protein
MLRKAGRNGRASKSSEQLDQGRRGKEKLPAVSGKSGTLGFFGGQNMASSVLERQLIDPHEKTGEAREIWQSLGD